jgi:hypothetical protein
MRMKSELRAAAGAVMAGLLIAGCGSATIPPPRSVERALARAAAAKSTGDQR